MALPWESLLDFLRCARARRSVMRTNTLTVCGAVCVCCCCRRVGAVWRAPARRGRGEKRTCVGKRCGEGAQRLSVVLRTLTFFLPAARRMSARAAPAGRGARSTIGAQPSDAHAPLTPAAGRRQDGGYVRRDAAGCDRCRGAGGQRIHAGEGDGEPHQAAIRQKIQVRPPLRAAIRGALSLVRRSSRSRHPCKILLLPTSVRRMI